MTLCYEVFLAEHFDSNSRRSIALMLHELYHTVQCVGRGGVGPFMDEYLLHGIGTIAQEGRIDIHDEIDHERDAESRSASLINEFGWPVVIDNACQTRIRVFVQILDRSRNWVSKGWYELDGGAKAGLEDGGFFDPSRYVHSSNRVWYYYAEELEGSRVWGGSHPTEFDGRTFMAREIETDPGEANLGVRLTCPRRIQIN
jgi:hypothetical protein